jgi:hypothetical protein
MRCAVVNDLSLIVENMIVADPTDPAPLGCFLVALADDQMCDIGWIYDGTGFYDPNPPAEPEAP